VTVVRRSRPCRRSSRRFVVVVVAAVVVVAVVGVVRLVERPWRSPRRPSPERCSASAAVVVVVRPRRWTTALAVGHG